MNEHDNDIISGCFWMIVAVAFFFAMLIVNQIFNV